MPIVDAIRAACDRRRLPAADVRSAEFISAVQIAAAFAEEPSRRDGLARTDPHWRVMFVGVESILDEGDGPFWSVRYEADDYLCVFADGTVMRHCDLQPEQ